MEQSILKDMCDVIKEMVTDAVKVGIRDVRDVGYFAEAIKLGYDLCRNSDFDFVPIFPKGPSVNAGYTERITKTMKVDMMKLASSTVLAGTPFADKSQTTDSAVAFTQTLSTIFHEFRHVQQFRELEEGTAKPEILFALLASNCGQDFYIANHSRLAHEVDANINGVIDTYHYIKKHHKELDPLECCKQLMFYHPDFENTYESRIEMHKLKTFNDLYKYLQNWKEKCLSGKLDEKFFHDSSLLYKMKEESPEQYSEIMAHYKYINPLLEWMEKGEAPETADKFYESTGMYELLTSLPDITEQCKMLGAYAVSLLPEFINNTELKSVYKQVQNSELLEPHEYWFAYLEARDDPSFKTMDASQKQELFKSTRTRYEKKHKERFIPKDKIFKDDKFIALN